MKNIEKIKNLDTHNEVIKAPEIIIREEKGVTLMTLLLKAYTKNFSSDDNELIFKIKNYFTDNPLEQKFVDYLNEIKAFDFPGTDGEALFNIALAYGNENRLDALFDFIAKNKKSIENAKSLQKEIFLIFNSLDKSLPSSLKKDINDYIFQDIKLRKEKINDYKKIIEDTIDFYKPKKETTKINQIVMLPTNILNDKKSGAAFIFNNELFISSHIENFHNVNHEFLHSIVNPIVDKLDKHLTNEEKERISCLASFNLKANISEGGQGYGSNYYSLLCEELIRTYNDIFQYNEKPIRYEDFFDKIEKMNQNQFNELLKNNKSFVKQCSQLDILTLTDFKIKEKEFFDTYIKNELREIIYEIYQDFEVEKNKDKNIAFEDFILQKFKNYL